MLQHAVSSDGRGADREYLDSLIQENDAARFLGFTVRALQNWRVRGGGPQFIKVHGRSVRYRRRDLIEWINGQVCSSTSQAAGQAQL